jgi:hypothetical protein
MVLASSKRASAVYFPWIYLALVALTLPFAAKPSRDTIPIWVLQGGLLFTTLAQSRLLRRVGNFVRVTKLFEVRSIEVSENTRIVGELQFLKSHYVRPASKFVFWIRAPDGTQVSLGSCECDGYSPQSMGRKLAASLSVPLDDAAPGAGTDSTVEVPTPKGLKPWLRRHRVAVIAALGIPCLFLLLSLGVDQRRRPEISMPCAGNGFEARLHGASSFVRRNGEISGFVNPGNYEITVWDSSRHCWGKRDIAIDSGHRLNVNCAWVMTSPVCLAK